MTTTADAAFASLGELLSRQAAARPRAAALHAPGRSVLDYGALDKQVGRAGEQLNGAGIGRGHRVAIVLPNGPDMAVAFLAVAAHACAAPLNPAYKQEEFAFHLDDMGADALLVEEGSDSPAIEVAQAHGIRIIELIARPAGPAGTFELHCADPGPEPARSGRAGRDETALVLHTSGTTSRPKLVPLTHANLSAAARNTCAAFGIGEDDRCLNMMPLFHAHGLTSTLLATLAGGGAIVCAPGFSDTGFFTWMKEFDPTWYSAVPTMHQALLAVAGDHTATLSAARLRFIRSASAPLPGPVLNALEDAFGVPVIEAYGMTEAGSLATANPLPPGARKLRSVGLPVGEPVAVLDRDGRPQPAGSSGEIAIRGENVMAGYEDNPEANRLAFTGGWLRTGDEGWLDEDGYLYISGRTKEIINRGGSKVTPAEIDEVLAGHPAVKLAVAFAVPHPTLGEDVAVAVVPRPDTHVTERDIREFTSLHLADFKVPSRVFLVADVPRTPAGKVQRLKLAELLAATGPVQRSGGRPRGPMERLIADVWSEALGRDHVGPDDNFFDLGGNSLLLARVAGRLKKLLDRELPLVVLTMYPTVGALAAHLSHAATDSPGTDHTPGRTRSKESVRHDRGKERLLRQRAVRGHDEGEAR
ncbi:AMP-binding protein [Streptomyces fagopyri]|uniref:AMP-binding protein n=1 Tax=Streptomyces fagopyri TaxID=2662397 RepID=UPI00380E79C0